MLKKVLSEEINIKLVMGLGNPGKHFVRNRHNFGYMLLDHIAEKHRLSFHQGNGRFLWARMEDSVDNIVYLGKPMTFMNNSGVAVCQAVRQFHISLADLLVIYDDIDLPLGKIRLRRMGSAGGHRGLRSVIENLETPNFARLRLGIGPQPPGITSEEFVLSDFQPDEQPLVEQIIGVGSSAISDWTSLPFDQLMNRYNSVDKTPLREEVSE